MFSTPPRRGKRPQSIIHIVEDGDDHDGDTYQVLEVPADDLLLGAEESNKKFLFGQYNCWILYSGLTLIRLSAIFLPGYIHPDEFYQSGQELFFGCPQPTVPWEFQRQHAIRSILPPIIMTWLPTKIYSLMTFRLSTSLLTGREIYWIPRLFCALLSVTIMDSTIYTLLSLKRSGRRRSKPIERLMDVPTPLWIYWTAWPAWLFLSRPFTNTLETLCLALLLRTVFIAKPSVWRDLTMGCVCAFGFFSRFTFIAFALPSGLYYLASSLASHVPHLGVATWSFCITSLIFVLVDSYYYRFSYGNAGDGSFLSSVVITPLRAFKYNAQTENLENHGLHPRWTHALVNMFILFGPAILVMYLWIGKTLVKGRYHVGIDSLHHVCLWTVLSGLMILSLAPHQEPRFLLPLLVPLTVVMKQILPSFQRGRNILGLIWLLFNAILLYFFGVLHQSGVLPSILRTSEVGPMVFYKTYMAPSFAIRQAPSCASMANEQACPVGSCPLDGNVLSTDDPTSLRKFLATHLRCRNRLAASSTARVQVVAPFLQEGDGGLSLAADGECVVGLGYECRLVSSHWPHLTTEDFPSWDGSFTQFVSRLKLSTFEVSCEL